MQIGEGATVALTVGTFDITHYGHFKLFKRCAHIADVVIVAVNTDEFVEKFKGKRPVMTLKERMENIRHCAWVDEVIENFSSETLKPLLEKIGPDFLIVGSDWAKKDYYKQIGVTQEWLDSMGIELIYVPYTESISTTELKERLKNGD